MKTAQPSLVSRLELVDGSDSGRLYAKKDSSFSINLHFKWLQIKQVFQQKFYIFVYS